MMHGTTTASSTSMQHELQRAAAQFNPARALQHPAGRCSLYSLTPKSLKVIEGSCGNRGLSLCSPATITMGMR